MRRLSAALVVAACTLVVALAQSKLTDTQVNDAIALGKRGKIPVLRIGGFMGDFDVYIAGPLVELLPPLLLPRRTTNPSMRRTSRQKWQRRCTAFG